MIETAKKPTTILLSQHDVEGELWLKNPSLHGRVSRVTVVDQNGETQIRLSEKRPGTKYKANQVLEIMRFHLTADKRLFSIFWQTTDEETRSHSFNPSKVNIYLKVNHDSQDRSG